MDFLSEEIERLLLKCVENTQNYPNILCEELANASDSEQEQLLIKVNFLINEGYLSSILWVDNLPYEGRIEQRAFDYFKQKKIYIRAKLRQDQYFVVLDEECEELLKNLISKQGHFILINDEASKGKLFEHLYDCGYIKLGNKGVSYNMSGKFTCCLSLTQKGINYFKDKELRIEEILTLGDTALVVNNIGNQFVGSLNGNTLTNSPFQIGNDNELNFDFDNYLKILDELKTEIQNLKLTNEQGDELKRLVKEAEESCKNRKESTFKKVLRQIWDFAKATGSGLLVAYLSVKFGLTN